MVEYLKDGEDFGAAHFSRDFGFHGSAHGGRNEDTYVARKARGGETRKGYAVGGIAEPRAPRPAVPRVTAPRRIAAPGPAARGPMEDATITMPVKDALAGAVKTLQTGRAVGARQAVGALSNIARERQAAQAAARPGAMTSPVAAPPPPVAPTDIPPQTPAAPMKRGGHLTTKARKAIAGKDFALPGRRYPIEDAAHARNALARISQFGSPAEKAEVRAKVHRKYPTIGEK